MFDWVPWPTLCSGDLVDERWPFLARGTNLTESVDRLAEDIQFNVLTGGTGVAIC